MKSFNQNITFQKDGDFKDFKILGILTQALTQSFFKNISPSKFSKFSMFNYVTEIFMSLGEGEYFDADHNILGIQSP